MHSYDPRANRWTLVADMPGGAADRSSVITNEAFAYDPVRDRWSTLPSATYSLYRSAGTCGLSKVGGSDGTFRGDVAVEQLSGQGGCASAVQLPWVAASSPSGTLAPGERRTIRVTFDARRITRAGTQEAVLRLVEDTPFAGSEVRVRLVVRP